MKGPAAEVVMLLSVRSPWLIEFARALAAHSATALYSPAVSWVGCLRSAEWTVRLSGCDTPVRCFPVQRGYFSRSLTHLVGEDGRILRRLTRHCAHGAFPPLIVSLPHYARVAERWPAPVVYYATDLFRYYTNWNYEHIRALETRLCRRADLVCPNSRRIAAIFAGEYRCEPGKIVVVPNGVRSENLLAQPLLHPSEPPADVADLPRPIAGVIGNLGANTDWVMVEEAVSATPWLSWLFVGPHADSVDAPDHEQARTRLLRRKESRVRFVGSKAPGELGDYARAFDAAVLPYRKREPTYSGSSTRFYEHLAATRPIIATDGFAELLAKQPLVKIVKNAQMLVTVLESLRGRNFQDGLEYARWRTSSQQTWECRARKMMTALDSVVLEGSRRRIER